MADGGQKFLPISDAMGRDIDAGRAKGRDVADFLPDAVAQELYDQSRPGPVHAENLIPITKAEAARRTSFDGETMPQFPATRRVIPAPYRRDRVTGGSHGKAWTTVAALAIAEGDIILPGIGLVTGVREEVRYEMRSEVLGTAGESPDDVSVAVGTSIVVTGAGGNVVAYDDPQELVRVFRRVLA